MRTRLFAVVVLSLLALMLVPVAGAQDDPGCFGLSEADCDAIDAASAALLDSSSMSLEWTLDVSVSGLEIAAMIDPEAGIPGSVTITASGSGVVDLMPESGDVGILQQAGEYEIDMGGETLSGSAEISIDDNVLYLVVDGEAKGVDISEEEMDMDPDTLADLLEVDSSALGIKGQSSMLPPEMLAFFNYQRSGDDFEFTVDVGGLLASEDFAMLLPLLLQMSGQEGALDSLGGPEALGMFTSAIESDITVSQSIDSSVPILTDLGFNMGLSFDIGTLFGDPSMDPVAIEIDFNASFSQFGEHFTVEAPADAEMMSSEEFEEMLDELMGGIGF